MTSSAMTDMVPSELTVMLGSAGMMLMLIPTVALARSTRG